MIPIAGISLLYNGFVNGFIGWRAYRAFHTTGSFVFRFYYQYSIILSIAFIVYGFSPTFTPNNVLLLRASYIIGGVFVLISFAFLIRFIFLALRRASLAAIVPFVSILCGVSIVIVGLLYPQDPYVDQYGLYHPNQSIPYDVVFSVAIALITIPTGLLFMFSPFEDARQKTRSVLLGAGFFVASIGSLLAITQNNPVVLASGFALMSIGFTSMLLLFLFSPALFAPQNSVRHQGAPRANDGAGNNIGGPMDSSNNSRNAY